MPIINIDGIEYDTEKLSDAVKQNLSMLQVTEQEIQQLQMKLAIAQTARNAYAQAVKQSLPTPLEQVQASETLKLS